MKIGVLIPSMGDRQNFVEQAKRMVNYQTLRPHKVYIVDAPGKPGVYDMAARTSAGIAAAAKDGVDRLFTWDDDEYYAPTYLEWLNASWPGHLQAIGVGNLPYYHLGHRRAIYREFPEHATNSCTAFCPKALVSANIRNEYPYDVYMWEWIRKNCAWRIIRQSPVPFKVIGMKHGQGGLTAGAHGWPPELYELDDADAHWLKAHVHPSMVEFYLGEGWKNGRKI